MKLVRLGLTSLLATTLLFTLAVVSSADVPAQAALYGIQPGTEIPALIATYGEPDLRHPFEDGWIALGYQFENHNLIVETAPDDPEYIITVQIEGSENPPGKGLLGINLGDDIDKALRAFGKPKSQQQAMDSLTNKPVPNTEIFKYSMASFEVVGGKITSIKTIFESRGAPKKKGSA